MLEYTKIHSQTLYRTDFAIEEDQLEKGKNSEEDYKQIEKKVLTSKTNTKYPKNKPKLHQT